MQKINIAIDGPAGAGKSTVARLVAEKLSYVYIDTGAMYRAVTWKSLEQGLSPQQVAEIIALTKSLNLELIPGADGQMVYVDGVNITGQLRTRNVSNGVSQISQIGEVRQILVDKQKKLASAKGVVMDGRDIGTNVLPDAEIKVFLTASVKERARRRYEEMRDSGESITLEQLEQDIVARDEMDQRREISPLVQARDAVLLDTTEMTILEGVDRILQIYRTKTGGE